MKKKVKKIGRPTDFCAKIADRICEELADGKSLRTICQSKGMPHRATVFRWLAHKDNQMFRDQYAFAREEQAEALVDEMLDIADDARNDWMEKIAPNGKSCGWVINSEAVQRSKIRLEARQWYARKMKPKKYGDRIQIDPSEQLTKAIVDVPARLSREQWIKNQQ